MLGVTWHFKADGPCPCMSLCIPLQCGQCVTAYGHLCEIAIGSWVDVVVMAKDAARIGRIIGQVCATDGDTVDTEQKLLSLVDHMAKKSATAATSSHHSSTNDQPTSPGAPTT